MQKKWIIIISVIVLLIIARLILPIFLKNKATEKLGTIPGHYGVVHDVDLQLYRGTYILDSIDIYKSGDSIGIPLISVQKAIISLDPDAVKQGEFLVIVDIQKAILNLIKTNYTIKTGKDSGEVVPVKQFGGDVQWMEEFKRLSPFNFNVLKLRNCQINYSDSTLSPVVSLSMTNINLSAENLGNPGGDTAALPSPIHASAKTTGNGKLELKGDLDFSTKPPDLKLDIGLDHLELATLNDLIHKESNISIEAGSLKVDSHIEIKDKKVQGTVDPVISDLKILSKEEKKNFFNEFSEKIAAFFAGLVENNENETIKTSIKIDGDLQDIEVGYLKGIFGLLKNAFNESYKGELEKNIP